MANSMLMDETTFMDPFDQDFWALSGQDTHSYFPPGSKLSSLPCISIPSFNSLYTSPTMEQAKLQAIDHFSTLSNTMITDPYHQPSSARFGLNFVHQNPSDQQSPKQVNPTKALNPEEEIEAPCGVPRFDESKPTVKSSKKRSRIRAPSQTYDHIIAERRRREQLSQLFVSLSALVPGLKKMDKGSVLEDGIKYMKHLQERVKKLEERAQKHPMESIVLVKKSKIVLADGASSEEHCSSLNEQPLPEVEAKVCQNHILLRVTCEKQKGVLASLICKVESLNMAVVNTNATLLDKVALDITIIAELEKDFSMTAKEVGTLLHAALLPST